LKVWDINMESRPVQTINIHDHLRNKLCDLYENDCIFDKFECTFSGDGKYVSSMDRATSLGERRILTRKRCPNAATFSSKNSMITVTS